MPSIARRLWKWTAGTLAALVILLGLAFGAFRLALEQLPGYRTEIQAWVRQHSGLDVEFASLDARWRLYGPELVFNHAVVRTADRVTTLATAESGSLALDLWGSLSSQRLRTGRFSLERPVLALIRTPEGRIELVGQDELHGRESGPPFDWSSLPTGRLSVVGASVSYEDRSRTDGRSWALEGVDFEIVRAEAQAEVEGSAPLPGNLGREIRFDASAAGSWREPAELAWKAKLNGTGLDLAGWADLLPQGWPVPSAGRGGVEVAMQFQGARLLEVAGRVDFENVELRLPTWSIPLPGPAPMVPPSDPEAGIGLPVATPVGDLSAAAVDTTTRAVADTVIYRQLALSGSITRQDGRWRASLPGLRLSLAPGDSEAATGVELEYERLAAGGFELELRADRLALDRLWPLLAFAPESQGMARARSASAHGVLADVSAQVRRAASEAEPTLGVDGRFESVGFLPVEKVPGFEGLTGEFRLSERGGQLELDARQVVFDLPRYFRGPLRADLLNGAFTWRRGEDGWRVLSNEVRIENADARVRATAELTLPTDGSSPFLDLEAQLADVDVAAAPRYLPAGRLRPKALEWLDRAFVAGTVPAGELSYRGPTRFFPFRRDEGTFLVRFPFQDVVLDYRRDWSRAERVSGMAEFRNAGFEASVDRADLHGLDVRTARVSIADFKTPVLEIDGRAEGDLKNALGYLQTSSVGPLLGERFMALEGEGATALSIELRLPIRYPRERRLNVKARLSSATLGLRGGEQRITGLTGPLVVDNDALLSPGLEGRLLGGPLELRLARADTAANEAVGTVLEATGRATAAELANLLRLPAGIRLSGETAWRLRSHFSRQAGAEPPAPWVSRSTIESGLEGLSLELPDPFGKPADSTLPLRVELQQEQDDFLVRAALGRLRAIGRVERQGPGWELDRATLRLDGAVPALASEPGLRIEGDVERFALEEWLALRGERGGGRKLEDVLRVASVRVERLELWGYICQDVRAVLRARDAGWRLDLAGDSAAGRVTWPYDLAGPQPIEASLERLTLLVDEDREPRAGNEGDPRRIPAVRARVGELEFGRWRLGETQLALVRRPDGVELEQFQARTEFYTVDLTGAWRIEDTGPVSSASLSLSSSDVRQTLQAFGFEDVITGDKAFLRAQLKWPGRPRSELLANASGTLSVSIDGGQLLKVQPGAGRVLGLLSVAAIPRRLALDFRDVTDKGFAFDVVQGDFELRDGDAYTSNLLLRGPAGEIGVVGRTGLRHHDYDQTAVVTGNLSGSLGVAGALAGGPVVGAAVLLFSEIFKQPLQGMTRSYYRITGSWEDPVVERVVEDEGKDAALQSRHRAMQASPETGPSGPATSQ